MRYKITIEYDGTKYCGWQKQSGRFSIQETIEKSIYMITKEKVEVFGSGRTDAGVHALGQVAHFDLNKKFDPYELISAINYYLKVQYISRLNNNLLNRDLNIQDISILDCEIVDESFHARFSAKKRFYVYKILNRRQPTALNNNRVWQIFKPLNFELMNNALKYLVGKRDWSSFRDSECQAKSPIKTIDNVALDMKDNEIIFSIEAKSFLHHMVRNIVGTLVDVGLEKINLDQFQAIIEAKDRTKAGATAPAKGLYFYKVIY